MSTTHFNSDLRVYGTIYTNDGYVKIHNHETTDGYALEVKSDPVSVSGTHFGVYATMDSNPSTATSAMQLAAVAGVGRLASGHTQTSGTLHGVYAQVCNLGTLNGGPIFASAVYALIEDGGTYTAVSHLAGVMIDSHLDNAVTSGSYEGIFLMNNGNTAMGSALYVLANNNITNLFTIETATGMVSDATTSDYTFTKTRLIKVVAGGETGYLVMDIP